ncbi:hypothetical protein [Thermofilum sp.]
MNEDSWGSNGRPRGSYPPRLLAAVINVEVDPLSLTCTARYNLAPSMFK